MFACVFIFDSCKKTDTVKDDHGAAREKFLSALDAYKSKVGMNTFSTYKPQLDDLHQVITSQGKVMVAAPPTPGVEPIYVDFPPGTPEPSNLIYNIGNVQQLSNLIDETGAIVQYDPTPENANNVIFVDVNTINNGLAPLIAEAKQYLYAKGFTSQDISDMIVEYNGTQEDLVPFVITLTHAESSAPMEVSRNYSLPFIGEANAKLNAQDYVGCAIAALGVDALWALGTSSASTWGIVAMKKAFGAVAKRMLGPIGVAITVVSFGLCLYEADHH